MDKEINKIQYCSAAEIAARWGISRRRVQVFCSQGRISGAQKIGSVWIIPSSAKKPEDPRKKR